MPGMGDTIYARDGKKFTESACTTRGPCFDKIMRGSKLQIGVIMKQDFGVTSEMIRDLFEEWDVEWIR